MKDALAAAGGLDYYSYEPFQVYAAGAVPQMAWVSDVGDLWRSSNDIRHVWPSILANARLTNTWAPNARPGHYVRRQTLAPPTLPFPSLFLRPASPRHSTSWLP